MKVHLTSLMLPMSDVQIGLTRAMCVRKLEGGQPILLHEMKIAK